MNQNPSYLQFVYAEKSNLELEQKQTEKANFSRRAPTYKQGLK